MNVSAGGDRESTPAKGRNQKSNKDRTTSRSSSSSLHRGKKEPKKVKKKILSSTPTILRAASASPADSADVKISPSSIHKNLQVHTTTSPSSIISNPKKATSKFKSPVSTTSPLPTSSPTKQRYKLLNSQLVFNSEISQKIINNIVDYTVVGCIGLDASGKSTIMSILEKNHLLKSSLNELSEDSKSNMFPVESLDNFLHGKHKTHGIDMCITSENLILLDCQSLLSTSVLSELGQRSERGALHLEEQVEINSLQLAVFLLSVCHYLVIADNYDANIEFYQFLRTAEMLKLHLPNISNELDDCHIAKAIFVSNKVPEYEMTEKNLLNHRAVLEECFRHSLFIARNDEENDPSPKIPHFTIPFIEDRDQPFCDHPAEMNLTKMRQYIYGLPRGWKAGFDVPLCDWVCNSAVIYDAIKKSSLVHDYSRFLRKSYPDN